MKTSTELRKNLADYTERTRNVGWKYSAWLGGIACGVGAAEYAIPEDHAFPIALGFGTAIWRSMYPLTRSQNREDYKNAIRSAEIDEWLADRLPAFESRDDIDDQMAQALLDMKKSKKRQELVELEGGKISSEDKYALWDLEFFVQDYRQCRSLASSLQSFTFVASGALRVESHRYLKMLEQYFPIDQQADTVVPPDEDSSKTWQMYGQMLASNPEIGSIMREAVYRGRDKKFVLPDIALLPMSV